MKKYIAEFIGTFCLLFAGTGAIITNDLNGGVLGHLGVSITFGLIVMAMIYSIGSTSGAHINPAVTIAFWAAKRLPSKEVVPYVLAQLSGAFLASGLLFFMFPEHETLGATLTKGNWQLAFGFEVILSFILMYVILNVSHGSKEEGIMAGAAIGATVALAALMGGPVSGASMNPARSLAPAAVSGNMQHWWVYIVATILGTCLSVIACRLTKSENCCNGKC